MISLAGPVAAASDPHDVARFEPVADGFGVLSNATAPTGSRDRVYLLEQHEGRVLLLEDGVPAAVPVLDLHDRLIEAAWNEEGLVGIALAPEGEALFVSYIDQGDRLVVSRFDLLDDGRRADPISEIVLLEVPRAARIHHCGHLEFGPADGLLYVCVGDMQWNTLEIGPIAQDPDSFRGKILRLDPQAAAPVASHDSHPLLASARAATRPRAEPEIWLKGLRNPWRFGFDPDAGLIYLPDIGRSHFEELSVLPLDRVTGNLGWPFAEGGECLVDCTVHEDLIWPVVEYSHLDDDCAIIGGTTYRGPTSPAWHGVYLFADLCSGRIWALRDAVSEPKVRLVLDSDLMSTALTRDHQGEILVVDGPGALYRLRLPAGLGAGWRPADEVNAEMAMAARQAGFSRTRELLDEARHDQAVMRESTRWRLTEPLVQMYNMLGRPLD